MDLTTKDVNGWHIADNPGVYQPATTNNFEFVIHDIDNLLKAGVDEATADAEDYLYGGQETIRLAVNKATAPHFTQNEITINRGNTKTYFAGAIEYSEEPIDVIDYVGRSGKSVLMAWQRLSGDAKSGAVGNASEYKKTCELIEYTPSYEKVRSWILVGCWVKGLSENDFNHEQNDKKVVTATIRYDRAYPND